MFRNYFSSRIFLVAFSIVCHVQALVTHFSCEAVGDVLSLIVSARRGSINLHIWSYIMLASYFLHHKYSIRTQSRTIRARRWEHVCCFSLKMCLKIRSEMLPSETRKKIFGDQLTKNLGRANDKKLLLFSFEMKVCCAIY